MTKSYFSNLSILRIVVFLLFTFVLTNSTLISQDKLEPTLCKEFDNFYTYDEIFQDKYDNFYLGFRDFYTTLNRVSKDLKNEGGFQTSKVGFDDYEVPVIYGNGIVVGDGYIHYNKKGPDAKLWKKFDKRIAKLSKIDALDKYVISDNAKYLISRDYGGGDVIKIYTESSKYKKHFPIRLSDYIKEMSISPSEKYAAVVSDDGKLLIIDLDAMKIGETINVNSDKITGFTINSKDQIIISYHSHTEVYSAMDGKLIRDINHLSNGNIAIADRFGDGLVVYNYYANSKNRNQNVTLYNLSNGNVRDDFIFPSTFRIEEARFSTQGFLYTFSYKKICVWDVRSNKDETVSDYTINNENTLPTNPDDLFLFMDEMKDKNLRKFNLLTLDLLCNEYSGVSSYILDDILEKNPENYGLLRLKVKNKIYKNDKETSTYASYARGLSNIKAQKLSARQKYNINNGVLQPYIDNPYDLETYESKVKFLIIHYINGQHLWELHTWMSDADANSKRSSPIYSMDEFLRFEEILNQYRLDSEKLKKCGFVNKRYKTTQNIIEKAENTIGGVSYYQVSGATKDLRNYITKNNLNKYYINDKADSKIYDDLDRLFNSDPFIEFLEITSFYKKKNNTKTASTGFKTIYLEDDHNFLRPENPSDISVRDMGKSLSFLNLKFSNSVTNCERTKTSDLKRREFQDWWLTKQVSYFDHEYTCEIHDSRLDVFAKYIDNKLNKIDSKHAPSDITSASFNIKYRENVDAQVIDSWFWTEEDPNKHMYDIAEGSDLVNVNAESTDFPVSVYVHDNGMFSSNVCEKSYIVSYEDKYGQITTSTDPYNDSSSDAGANGNSFPIICTVMYKNDCNDSKYKIVKVRLKEKGDYTINLEEW